MSSLTLERLDLSHPAFVGASQALELRPDISVQADPAPQSMGLSLGEQLAAVVAEADRSMPAFSMTHNALSGKEGDSSNAEGLSYKPSVFVRGTEPAQPLFQLKDETATVVLDRVAEPAPEAETAVFPKVITEAATAVNGLARSPEIKVHRRAHPTIGQALSAGLVALSNAIFAPRNIFGHQGRHRLATA